MSNVFCNPLSLPYSYQKKPREENLFREASDPTALYWREKYWIFASMSGGFWYSEDMAKWKFHKTSVLPDTDYAPDVCIINDKMYFVIAAPGKKTTIYATDDPLNDEWKVVSQFKSMLNPHIFADDDKRIYLYWGCSKNKPICGIQLDETTFKPVGTPVEIIKPNPVMHGFEINSENNIAELNAGNGKISRNNMPFIEGAWMTKHNGKYYLQYAAPSTQHNVYGDGVYVGTSPLGEFHYQPHNPVSFKPGGFITGAGHGSTFKDKFGNYWHIATMRISVNDVLERRLGLFPAGFDKEGTFYCNNDFGDYPTLIPEYQWNPFNDSKPNWNLLTYKKPVSSSSIKEGSKRSYIVDENIRTFWSASEEDKTPWVVIDLSDICRINAVQVNFADSECRIEQGIPYNYHGAPNARRDLIIHSERYEFTIEVSENGREFFMLKKCTTLSPHEFLVFDEPVKAKYLLIRINKMPHNGRVALSGVRAFGTMSGFPPEQVHDFKAERKSSTSAVLTWTEVPGALGYNIKWGISPEKLYSSWCVYGKNSLDINCLNINKKYYFSIEAFNEKGLTRSEGMILV